MSEITLESMQKFHEERIQKAQSSGRCEEYVGRESSSSHCLKRCKNRPLAGDYLCEEHRAMEDNGMKPCYACGQPYSFVTPYLWEARQGRTHGGDMGTIRDQKIHCEEHTEWNVWAVTPCCGRTAHTETVATFHGYLHNSKKNAQQACELHNADVAAARLRWEEMRAKVKKRMAIDRPITDAEAKELWPHLYEN